VTTEAGITYTVTAIGEYAFKFDSSLTAVTIPGTVTSIEKFAFSNCESLMSVNIPASVTSIGIGVFEGCTLLTSIDMDENPNYVYADKVIYSKDLTCIQACLGSLEGEFTIPDYVTKVESHAFRGCANLTKC